MKGRAMGYLHVAVRRTGWKGCRAALLPMAVLMAVAGCASVDGGGPPPVARESRAPARAVPDSAIREDVLRRWAEAGEMHRHLDLSVKEGRVLITGRVRTPDDRVEAVRRAWQAEGVVEVINEVQIDDASGLSDKATDAWITAQFRTKLLLDTDVGSRNYAIDTVNQVLYIMGRAGSQAELDRVLQLARQVPRVRRVVSHVHF